MQVLPRLLLAAFVSILASGCAAEAHRQSAFDGASLAIEWPVAAVLGNCEEDLEKTPELFGADGDYSLGMGNSHIKPRNLILGAAIGEPTGVSMTWVALRGGDKLSLGADVLVGCGWNGGPSLHASTDLIVLYEYETFFLNGLYCGPGVRYRDRNGNINELGPRVLFGGQVVGSGGEGWSVNVAPGYDFKNQKWTIDCYFMIFIGF
jgi:hypothetical protein